MENFFEPGNIFPYRKTSLIQERSLLVENFFDQGEIFAYGKISLIIEKYLRVEKSAKQIITCVIFKINFLAIIYFILTR